MVLRDEEPPRIAAAGEVFLEPADSTGPDPFTPSVDTNTAPPPVLIEPVVTVPTVPSTTSAPGAETSTTSTNSTVATSTVTTTTATTAAPASPDPGGVRTVNAAAPGLYGGTQDDSSCDQEAMIDFLTDTPEKRRSPGRACRAIAAAEIPAYIRSLTPVVLRADTRVTNHGYRDGLVTTNQSILQAGTAVLVDDWGIPRARCSCGNPLTPPIAQQTGTTYVGDPWPGFRPTSVVVIQNVTNVQIDNFVLVDLNVATSAGRLRRNAPEGVTVDGGDLRRRPL